MMMLVFWVKSPCGLIGRYQRFGGTYCPHLQGHFYLLTSPHGVTTQNNVITVIGSITNENNNFSIIVRKLLKNGHFENLERDESITLKCSF
jgi:hypothetical protein